MIFVNFRQRTPDGYSQIFSGQSKRARRKKGRHHPTHHDWTKEHDHSSFYQFLQMEHSQKNTDCYFFYYSTCLKGDACAFRHEPTALGCETMCSYWQQGNCLNEHCNFRHMELKKNRKSIPCYWEGQPGGCRKPHCCFMHKNARGPATAEPNNPVRNNELTSKPVNQEWSNRQDDGKYDSDLRTTLDGSSTESDQGRGGSEAGSFIGSPAVDPLVVNFEEESDNESVPSPTKPQLRLLHVKTLEEIKLERIQAESAAYYNYAHDDIPEASLHLTTDRSVLTEVGGGSGIGSTTLERNLRARLANRLHSQGNQANQVNQSNTRSTEVRTSLDFQVLSLDEIRKRRRRMPPLLSAIKIPRIAENCISTSSSSSLQNLELPEIAIKLNSTDEKSDVLVRWPKAALTPSAPPPPVRLRRANKNPSELSPRKKIPRYSGGNQEPLEMTSSDSSQEAAAIPDRLTLVASRPSLSARDEREEILINDEIMDEGNNGIETRLQEQNGILVEEQEQKKKKDDEEVEEGVALNGGSGIRVSRSISVPSVSEDDYLMMDTGSIDHSTVADDILQDIDELLNDD